MLSKNRVSIIIPVYNGEKYIKESIESALNQDYENIEVIVVNDGSKDNTDAICKTYKDKIRYFNKKNGGVSSALNLGLKEMTGEYFSWLSHDDLYDENKISEQIKLINNCHNIILYGDYRFIDSQGDEIGEQHIKPQDKSQIYHPILNGEINGITLLIPKTILDDVGCFDENARCTQDYDMWFRIIQKGYKFIHIDKILTSTRLHEGQDTITNPAVYTEGNKLWMNIIKYCAKKEKNKFDFYAESAKRMYRSKYEEVVDYCLEKCSRLDLEKTKELKHELKKISREMSPSAVKRTINYLKKNGIKKTIKRIIKK